MRSSARAAFRVHDHEEPAAFGKAERHVAILANETRIVASDRVRIVEDGRAFHK